MSQVVVTGATGFIGTRVVQALIQAGHSITALTRQPVPIDATGLVRWIQVTNYSTAPELDAALTGTDAVIMLADTAARDSVDDCGLQGIDAAPAGVLARRAQALGVNRVIYISSLYARLAAQGQPAGYGAYKWVNEQALAAVPDLSAVILRLPPVYGPGGKGGFHILAKLVEKLPVLPFGLARAPRSYLAVENAADAMVHLVGLASADWAVVAGNTYAPHDGAPIATRDLITALGQVMGRQPRHLPVPLALLRGLGAIAGKSEAISGALDPLLADDTPSLVTDTGWQPPVAFPQTLAYLARR